MSKTFKTCVIFFIATLWLVIMRVCFGFLNLSDNLSNWFFSLSEQIIGLGVIPLALYKFWVKEDVRAGFSIKAEFPSSVWFFAVILGFLMSYLTIGVSMIWQGFLGLTGFTHVNSSGVIYSDPGVLFMELLTVAVLPAFFEELTDRGLVMGVLRDIGDNRMAMILMAALFSLGHMNIVQTGYTFVGGLIISYLALETGSIFPGMILHFINNGLDVLGGWSGQHGGLIAFLEDKIYEYIINHVFIAIFGWVITAGVIILILRHVASQCRKKREERAGFYFGNAQSGDFFAAGKKGTANGGSSRWYEYAFLYGAAALGFLATLFTFVWGLLR